MQPVTVQARARCRSGAARGRRRVVVAARTRVPRGLRRGRAPSSRRRTRSPSRRSPTTTPRTTPTSSMPRRTEGGELVDLLQHLRGELGADLPRLQEEVPLGRERLGQRPRQRRGLPEGAQRAGHRLLAGRPGRCPTPRSAWADFAERDGTLMEYESPELGRAARLRPAAAERVRDVDRPDDRSPTTPR